MKLSLTIQTPEVNPIVPVALLTGSIWEKIEKAAKLDVQGIELMTIYPEQLDVGGIYTEITKHGLHVAAISSGAIAYCLGITLLHADPKTAEVAEERLYHLIDFAAEMKSRVVTVGSFRGRLANHSGGNGRQELAGILRKASEYAQPHSVCLAIEPLNRYETDFIMNVKQGFEFVSEIDHPSVGLLLDTYHVNIEENSWTKPFKELMKVGKLFHVHLGDNNRLSPGRGLINFREIVNVLVAMKYDGYLSAELLGNPDPDTAAYDTIRYMQTLIYDIKAIMTPNNRESF